MVSFQEVCLMYCGEKDIANIDKERLIYCIHIYESLVGLDKSVQDKKLAVSEFHKELNDEFLTKNYNELKEKYQYLHDKWEEFSKCLKMGPEKFISMLNDLKEELKSKGNEIAHLREQLKTSELDAKRYKNDGIQDRVKLQEVVIQLESMTKMRDNWKADCEYSEKCFQAERDRRWELEEEVKQLKNKLMEPKVDCPCYVKNKKELNELIDKKLSKFQHPYIDILQRPGMSYFSIYMVFDDYTVPLFIDSVKNTINKDDYALLETEVYYTIVNKRNGDYLYTIDKLTKNVKTLKHLKFIKLSNIECKDCDCACSSKKCIKPNYTQIYFSAGAQSVLVDTLPYDVRDYHYYISEDKTNKKYCIVRKDPMQRNWLHNYSIDKNTLEVKVID